MLTICQKIIIFSTILLLSIKYVATFNHDRQQRFDITRNLSEALVELISDVFVDKFQRRVFNFQVKVTNKNNQQLHEFRKIIDETMLLLHDNITIQLRNGYAIPPDNERHYCVLLVDSSESLEYLYSDLHEFHLHVQGSYFIILQTHPHIHHYYDELFEIFQLSYRRGIQHANVLVHAVNNCILLFHNMPFTRFHCKNVAPIIQNKFIDGVWLHMNFVTEKFKNLYGCPLVCATWEDMPYFQLNHDYSRDKKRSKYLGLEGKLLEYFSQKMNFKIIIRWLSDKEINQTIYDEQGVFNMLFTSNTDFVIGAFHYKPTSLKDPFAPTTAYYMSHYYFIVSAKTDPYDPFTKLLLPFEVEIWIIIILIFIFVNIVLLTFIHLNRKWKSLVLGAENNTPGYNMIVISLGGPVAKDPKVSFSRFLLILWLLATFILRTVYQGFMFHFIKSDLRKPPAKEINELFHNEYRILMTDAVYASVADLPRLSAQAEVSNKTQLEMFEMLRHPKDYKPYKLAILTPMEYYGYYKFATAINDDFYVVPEKLFSQQLSIYMKKNSEYLRRFNMYIENYLNEGLMNRFERLLVFDGGSRRATDDTPKPMKFSHLFAAYRLLFIGLIASLIAFIGEIIIFKMKLIAKRFRNKKHPKPVQK